MDTFIYFAYGSNMLTERLRDRCPSAEPVGLAEAHGYKICFKKKSKRDGSGKATLVRGNPALDKIPGVLFQIYKSELGRLDRAEGNDKGYYRDNSFPVVSTENGKIFTITYIAEKLEEGLSPYDWYLAFVVAGSLQHNLSTKHTEYLKTINTTESTILETEKARDEAFDIIQKAGYESVFQELTKKYKPDK